MSKPISVLTVMCLFLFLLHGETTGVRKPCKFGTYWDHGTNKCDQCNSICHMAEQQGTVDACEKKCPGFSQKVKFTPKTCKKDWYYDKHVAKCEPCGPLCESAQLQKTTYECNSKCPGFLTNEITYLEIKEQDTPIQNTQDGLTTHMITMYAMTASFTVVGSVVLVLVVVVGVKKWWKRNRVDHDVTRRPVQVDDDTDDSGPEYLMLGRPVEQV